MNKTYGKCRKCGIAITDSNVAIRRNKPVKSCSKCHNFGSGYSLKRAHARDKQIDFSLTRQQFVNVVHQPCAYCGNFQYSNYNTIDRINSEEGYSITNSVAACWRCNMAKGAAPLDEWIEWIAAIKSYQIDYSRLGLGDLL